MTIYAHPTLVLEQVSRRSDGKTIVYALDLSVHCGEVLGLLGINGAGKSTTLKMIAGVLNPSNGRVLLNGNDLSEHAELARRHIGYLPEQPPLYDELTVAEYLHFCAQLHAIHRGTIKAAVERVIESCELGDVRHRLIRFLSKGYRQRVGLAQAIIHAPELIILDEPASGLDPVQALKLRELIKGLRAAHAVVLSTHVLSDVTACCNRVAILHEGHLRHSSTLAELEVGQTLEKSFMRIVATESGVAV